MIKFLLETETGSIGFSEKSIWKGQTRALRYFDKSQSRRARLRVFNQNTGKFEPRIRFQLPAAN